MIVQFSFNKDLTFPPREPGLAFPAHSHQYSPDFLSDQLKTHFSTRPLKSQSDLIPLTLCHPLPTKVLRRDILTVADFRQLSCSFAKDNDMRNLVSMKVL
jgi:hypothetical protein